ncbi:MAG: glycoside hydrolase family 88 protein [Oceanispirochaeta sp.]|nr:glycoside hydrolase family 88 protein [Oceanispirochaeta sp.]MDA3958554.1 glycoside hydrolase family 88 protein [Oceanispirochaeta sp.]
MQRYSWEQGVAAQAFLERREYKRVLLLCREAVCRQIEDGRLASMGEPTAVTDHAAIGEALVFTARTSHDMTLQQAVKKMADYLLNLAPRSPKGIIYHLVKEPQIWVDSMYMSPPFLAAYGCKEEALNQLMGMKDCLYDEDRKLYSHIWDDKTQTFLRKSYWGVGNGWAAAGIVRVLKTLGNEFLVEKQQLLDHLRELIDSFLSYTREDFLFHDVLDQPSSFVETNSAQMIGYTIFRCLESKWINPSYFEVAKNIREAVHKKVDQDGLVQGVCGAPQFVSSGVAPEGQSFFLLMEAAYKDLMNASSGD